MKAVTISEVKTLKKIIGGNKPSREPAAVRPPARWLYLAERDGEVANVPELVSVGSDEIRKVSPIGYHDHPDCYEFVLVEQGKTMWELDGKLYDTYAGDVFHSRPYEQHRGGYNMIEPSKFWWVIVHAPTTDRWLGLAAEEIITFRRILQDMPRIVHTGMRPVEPFERLKRELQSDGPLRSVAVRQALLDILLAIAQPDLINHSVADDLLLTFRNMIDRMKREPDKRLSIPELALGAGVSLSHFYRTFQAYTGFTPTDFMERIRINEAFRRLTETDVPVTDLALELGYSSSQYFATVFKRYTGMTPSRWREQSLRSPRFRDTRQ